MDDKSAVSAYNNAYPRDDAETVARMCELLRNVHHFLMYTNGGSEERHALLIKVQDELDRG